MFLEDAAHGNSIFDWVPKNRIITWMLVVLWVSAASDTTIFSRGGHVQMTFWYWIFYVLSSLHLYCTVCLQYLALFWPPSPFSADVLHTSSLLAFLLYLDTWRKGRHFPPSFPRKRTRRASSPTLGCRTAASSAPHSQVFPAVTDFLSKAWRKYFI